MRGALALSLPVAIAAGLPGYAQRVPLHIGPAPISRAEPEFPFPFDRAGMNATCMMTYDIAAEGSTENICGVCSFGLQSDYPADFADMAAPHFLRAAAAAVSDWRFARMPRLYSEAHTVIAFRSLNTPAPEPEAPEPVSCMGEPIS
jgi:hypothetical protein